MGDMLNMVRSWTGVDECGDDVRVIQAAKSVHVIVSDGTDGVCAILSAELALEMADAIRRAAEYAIAKRRR